MSEQPKMERIICGDNLEILKSIPAESVDLCYIDPPFFTQRNYEIIWNDGAEIRQFEDRWVKEGDGRYSKDINVYLNFMEPRIKEIYRVLKPTGSFYLHCDDAANSYLRILCDQIFGYDNMLNTIIWNYSGTGNPKKNFKRKHDTIFLYNKSKKYIFNPITELPSNINTIKRYDKIDDSGKRYKIWNNKGDIRKVYMKEMTLDDVWDISVIGATSSERLGYPTQKPEALLERIIFASSNEGDIVLDAFCGCGTTLAVAKRLKRHFIGIDVSPTACRLVAKRLELPVKIIEGMALTPEEISELSGYEFQNYIIHLLTLDKSAIKVNNRGADGGIDGFFFDELISVKKYKAGRKDLDELVATMYRNKKIIGIFMALDFTSDFIKEVARLKREQEIIILHFNIQQILNREHEKELVKYRTDLKKFL